LVVDDYEPFRRFVCATLEKMPDLQVVGEASDGLEAVHQAEQLQPDLIVLDLGLPTLNGIEAARRIRKLSPESKILFVSQESSADLVQAALNLGALGYVVKAQAARGLLTAVQEVCLGRQFVSEGVLGNNGSSLADMQAPGRLAGQEAPPSLSPRTIPRTREIDHRHTAEFYSDDPSFVVGFADFIESALDAGNAVIAVVTESHLSNLLQNMRARGLNIGAAIEQGRFIPLDVAETISTFMVDDLLDPARFLGVVGDLIGAAARATAGDHSRVAVCGESASILWAQGNADAAIQLEQLCNQVSKRYGIDILCGFSLSSFYREEDKRVFQRICSA
jgi:DNA-binding NarL/FixJ family response regulator